METLRGVEGTREACQPKPSWSAGSGHGDNSPGARDDGYRIGIFPGSPAGEIVLSYSSWERVHLLLAAPAVLSFGIIVGTVLAAQGAGLWLNWVHSE